MMSRPTLLLTILCALLSLYTALAGTSAEGIAYLEAKGKEEGVVTLPSGLMYKEILPGKAGGKTPSANSPVYCHYSGALIDGIVFDSSWERGEALQLSPSSVFKGFGDALQLMTEGARWELYIPSELGFGDSGSGDIPGGSVLLFTLELLKVNDDDYKKGIAYLEAKGREEGVVTTSTGLMYKVLRAGNAGGKTPTFDSPCECHYAGTLIDGTEFDSSYARGEPTTFAPNEVIGGWTEALQLMTEGAKWELYIPSELGYGSRGSGGDIPGGAALVFTLELLKVMGDHVKTEL